MEQTLNRREFIVKSALAAAGTSLLTAQAACSPDDRPLNLALIGAGTQGRVLLADCLKLEGIRFRAVCDIWSFSQRYAANTLKKFGQEVNVYEDYREMLESEKEVDAVIIASPDFVHAEQAAACMEAGLDVYCEKEMAHNLQASASLVLAEQRTGRLLQIGHQRRSNPVYQLTRQALDEEELAGRITNCYGQWHKSVQPLLTWPEKYEIPGETLAKYGYETMHQFRNWRWFRKYSGGPVSDNGSHQIDIFSWFLNSDPAAVMASGGGGYFEGREWYEDAMAIYEYPYGKGGKQTTVRASYQVLNTNGFGGFYERFQGEGGTITISEFPDKCLFTPEPATQLPAWAGDPEPLQISGGFHYPLQDLLAARSEEAAEMLRQSLERTTYMWHLDNFFQAVRKGDRAMLNCNGAEAFRTAAAVFGVSASVDTGKTKRFDPSDFKV